MAMPVVTVAAGGMAVVDAGALNMGMPVTEAANGFGRAVSKVAAGGMPVRWATIMNDTVPFVATTWNPADKSAGIALSNANLTATASAGNAAVRTITSYSTGLIYFEERVTVWIGTNTGPGIATIGSALGGGVPSTGKCGVVLSGTIYKQAASSGFTLGARAAGDIIGIAINLNTRLVWYRVCPIGSWNAVSGSANDPVAGVGGVDISGLVGAIAAEFSTGTTGTTDAAIANFGASAFSGAVPSGFTAGWSA